MSDIHVLTTNRKGSVSVVFHIPVPEENNSAVPPVSYRTAIVNSGKAVTSMTVGVGPGEITQAEADDIASGAVYEHSTSLPLASSGTEPAQHQAALRDLYARTKTDVLSKLQRQLKYFGHTESEV